MPGMNEIKLRVPRPVQQAFKAAAKSRKNAHAPYSKFQVGAGLIAKNGKIYGGCNVENASYGGTVCAERVAVFSAVAAGDERFTDIVVVTDAEEPAFPCAFCLQVMAEFFDPETRVWVANLRGPQSMHLFSELLPKPFGPRQLKRAKK